MRPHLNRIALRTSLIYLSVAGLWILLFDPMLAWFVSDLGLRDQLRTYQGGAFAVVTAVLLYVLLARRPRDQHHGPQHLTLSADDPDLPRSLLTATLESTKDGILVVSREGRIESYNQVFVEMWHMDPVILQEGYDCIALESVMSQLRAPEEFRQKTRAIYRAEEDESFDQVEFTDGRVFERYSHPQKIGDQVLGRVWSFRDITERKRAEQALRDSEERFHALFAESHLVIMLTDMATGRIADANRMAEKVLGFRLVEARGRTTGELNIWHRPKDRDLYVEALRATGSVEGLEVQINRSDGTPIDMLLHGQRIAIAGVDYVLTSAVDITKRKQIEAELRWRTAFFEAQLESSVDGILVVDEKNRKIVQNQRMIDLWKIPPEFAAEEDDTRQVRFCTQRTQNPEQFLAKIEHLYAHPREVCEDEIELDDGTVLSRYTAGVWDSEGQYYGRIWAFRDITERQQLEGRLRQAQKMEAIGQLAGGVAHDFNNLLTAIVGHLGLIRIHENLDPDVAESLEAISGAASRAANLTSQLLTFSRRQVLSVVDLDLNTVVTQLTKMLRRVLGEHIAMHVDYAADQLMFRGDAGMIDQVLLNLAVNARDAMPDSGTLRISTSSVQRADAHGNEATFVHLTVGDTGTGISPDVLPHIFEPFYTTKEVGKGTGLGLATVFGIIEQHEGTIEVESQEGRGTEFHVYFPQITPTESAAEEAAALPVAAGQGETILLVEDEPAVREVGVRTLRRFGYRVLTATNGPEALAVWSDHRLEIDLLLTDMIMPGGLSGRQLARQLITEKTDLRVVYTSGYSADIADKDHLMRDGINYLAKPYEVSRLCQIVRAALDRSDSAPPL